MSKRSSRKRNRQPKTPAKESADRAAGAAAGRVGKAKRRRLSRRKLWLFRILAATLVPALLLGLTEGLLRIAGYGYNTDPFLPVEIEGQTYYCNNDAFSWRFFPQSLAREFDPFRFAAAKPANTFRIFILGSSAAQGAPDGAYGFGRILEAMLQEAYQPTAVEVINLSLTAINSHVVRDLADACLEMQPDLLLVYLGNNEVVGPFGPANSFRDFSASQTLIRTSLALRKTRLGQLVGRLGERWSDPEKTPGQWRGMEQFLENQIRPDDPRLPRVYDHFQANLRAICSQASKKDCPVILCTVAGNLRHCPPFGSQHRQNLTDDQKAAWDAAYRQADALEGQGDADGALAQFQAAAGIDQTFAELSYRLGRCWDQRRDYEQAAKFYVLARDQDTLRFRADSRINEVIRQVARQYGQRGTYLLDAAKRIGGQSPQGICGEEVFHEHVHLNFHGNYLLARLLCEQIDQLAAKPIRPVSSEPIRILSEAECAERLVFTAVSRLNVASTLLSMYIQKPPFTQQWNHAAWIEQKQQEQAVLARKITPALLKTVQQRYQQALGRAPDDFWLRWRYAELLSMQLENPGAAIEQCRRVLERLPRFRRGHEMLGTMYIEAGRFDEAIEQLETARSINPASFEVLYHLGDAHQKKGELDQAERCYRQLLRGRPDHTGGILRLGMLYFQQGRVADAVEVVRRGIEFRPENAYLHYILAMFLKQQGKLGEAREALEAAQKIEPDSEQVRRALEAINNPLQNQKPPAGSKRQ